MYTSRKSLYCVKNLHLPEARLGSFIYKAHFIHWFKFNVLYRDIKTTETKLEFEANLKKNRGDVDEQNKSDGERWNK